MLRFLFLYFFAIHFFVHSSAMIKNCYHDFYLSICEIEYNEINHSFEICIRVFNDDLEKAVCQFNKVGNNDKYENQKACSDEKIKNYLLSKITFSLDNNQPRVPDFIGWETKEGTAWCYLELKNIDNFTTLGISCTMLTEMFERQKNLIYLKKNKAEKSVILDKEKTFCVIVL